MYSFISVNLDPSMTERLQKYTKNLTSLPQKNIEICSYHRILKSEFKNIHVFKEKKKLGENKR